MTHAPADPQPDTHPDAGSPGTLPPPLPPLPPPPPAWARMATLGLSVVLALSTLPGLWVTLFRGDAVLWFSTVFELLVLAAAGFGVAAGLGRFRQGWGLALACVAGTVLVCGVFAFLEVRANFGDDAGVGGRLKAFLAMRLGLAALLATVASLAIFARNRRSWGALAKAAALFAPVILVGVLAATGHTGPLGVPRESPGAEAARIIALCFGGLVAIGLVSVGGHLVIRAYEHGRPEEIHAARNPGSRA